MFGKTILLVIGVVSLALNGFFFIRAEEDVKQAFDAEIRGLQMKGMQVDPVKARQLQERAVNFGRLYVGAFVALSVVFIILGFFVMRFPVPITITALVLYIGAAAIAGLLDPTTLVQGIIVKVIIVFALVKAVSSAIAYERDKNKADSVAMPAGTFGDAM